MASKHRGICLDCRKPWAEHQIARVKKGFNYTLEWVCPTK